MAFRLFRNRYTPENDTIYSADLLLFRINHRAQISYFVTECLLLARQWDRKRETKMLTILGK